MKKLSKRGFTLVELMIVVAIIGVLAALAIYGVRRYLANAKTAEARNSIGAINRGAVQGYERESGTGEILVAGTSGSQTIHSLCLSTLAVPAGIATVANRKYQPNPANGLDYATPEWRCLKFELTEPQYFMYKYTTAGYGLCSTLTNPCTAAVNASGWAVEAAGDLNGDAAHLNSCFCLLGDIDAASQTAKVGTLIEEVDAEE